MTLKKTKKTIVNKLTKLTCINSNARLLGPKIVSLMESMEEKLSLIHI